MKPSASHDDLLQAEIARLCDACLFDGEDLNPVEQLQALLLSNPQAIDAYWTWIMDAANLRLLATTAATEPTSEVTLTTLPVVRSASRPSVFHRILGHIPGGEFTVGALVIFVVTAAFWGLARQIMWPRLGEANIARSEIRKPERAAVATILDSDDVQWSGRREASLPPAIRRGGRLRIESGLVELELKQGVKLVIEGPADWTIDGNNNATLKRGRLVAKVPEQAIGFTLQTPTAKIVDLGTEFGADVKQDGSSTVTVLKGGVETHSIAAGGKSVRLSAGQAVRIGRSNPKPEAIPFDSQVFANIVRRQTSDAKPNGPVLLFSDNFSVHRPSDDINPGVNDKPDRQSGLLAPLKFRELEGKTAASTQLGSPVARHGLTLAGDAVVRTSVIPAIDFVQQKSKPARYKVEFLLNPGRRFDGAQDTQGNWGGVHVGASEPSELVPGAGCGVTFLIRGDGGYQLFERENLVREGALRETLGAADVSGWCKVLVDFEVPAFDGVSPATVKTFVNDRLLLEYQTQSGFTNNFIGLDGMSVAGIYHTIDDFKVSYEEISAKRKESR